MTTATATPTVTRTARLWFWGIALSIWAANALLVRFAGSVFGSAPFDVPVAVDVLLVVPLLYLWVHRRNGARAWLGALTIAGIGLLVARWILPPPRASWWDAALHARWWLGGAVVALELGVVLWVVRLLWRLHGHANLEVRLEERLAPQRATWGAAAGLITLEARMWLYALLPRPVAKPFPGRAHFYGAQQQSNASNQQAFLILIAMELPLMHGLLHFFVSPTTAWIVTALSLYGWCWMLAEFRATRLRPVSLGGDVLHLRYGVVTDARIPLAAIVDATPVPAQSVRRAKGRLRCNGMGAPNVRLHLQPDTYLDGIVGRSVVTEVYLGVDTPQAFLQALHAARQRA